VRIQIGQKIHGALLAASMQFMRERVMDVYMENYEKTNFADDAEVHRCKRPTEGLKHLHELGHGRRWSWVLLSVFFKLLLEVVDEDG
jgi:hypothetical protein